MKGDRMRGVEVSTGRCARTWCQRLKELQVGAKKGKYGREW